MARPSPESTRLQRGARQGFLPLARGSEGPSGVMPWERPWWLPAPGGWPTFLWVILIHLTALVGLVLVPLPDWRILLGAVVLAWLGGMGTTVGYHRAIAHHSLRLHPIALHVLTFLAMLNGSGSPL